MGRLRFDFVALTFIPMTSLFALISRITGYRFTVGDMAVTLTFSLNLMGLFQWMIRYRTTSLSFYTLI